MTERSAMPRQILAVHQGYELYGSDRIFISSLQSMRTRFPDAGIKVVLPREGLLSSELQRLGFEVELCDLWIARKANGIFGNVLLALAFPAYLFRAWRKMNAASLTYVNTSVVFDYALAARLTRSPTLLHVHELPTGFARQVIRMIARLSGATLLFISEATRSAFEPLGSQASVVVLNGVPDRSTSVLPVEGQGQPDGRLRILMIGRINDWKGQDLLVDALASVPADLASTIELRLLGSAFEDGPAERQLKAMIEALDLACSIRMEGFVADPSEAFQWCDFIVVPSRKPEPFGLVAIEAMMHGRAVIAAGHGGLREIVVANETGLFFTPNNAHALADAICSAAANRQMMRDMGAKGRVRFKHFFSIERYQQQIAFVASVALEGGPLSESRPEAAVPRG